MPAFTDRVRHVRVNEAVSPGVTSRPTREIESNVRWLRDVLDAAQLGQGLIARDQAIVEDAQVGQPVFWDAEQNRYELAVAGVETADGDLQVTAASRYTGLVLAKHHPDVADIALLGLFTLDLSVAVGATPLPGVYYLSGAHPGTIIQQRQPVTIPVCHYLGDNKVLLTAPWRNLVDDHTHYSFELYAQPAGDHAPSAPTDPHAITNADADLAGWLPANHAIFDGNAPTGAVFGYNLSQHAALWRVWPPIPITAVRVVWDKGADLVGGTEVPLGEDGLVVTDANGIWWMSDGYLDVPWANWTYAAGVTADEPSGDPRAEVMRVILDFGRMGFATSNAAVTRLVTDSPLLEIVSCDGEQAATGDLLIRLLMNFVQADNAVTGHQVIKQFDHETLELERGTVVEGLRAGAAVTLVSDTTRPLDPADPSGEVLYQGVVQVNHDADPAGREFSWEVIRSDEMRQRYDGNVIYTAFPAAHASGLRSKAFIPPVGLPSPANVVVRLTLLGTGIGTIPALTCTRRRIPLATTPTAIPTGDTACDWDVEVMPTVGANEYFQLETEPFVVEPGDTLFIAITRAGNDGYGGEVGILRASVALV